MTGARPAALAHCHATMHRNISFPDRKYGYVSRFYVNFQICMPALLHLQYLTYFKMGLLEVAGRTMSRRPAASKSFLSTSGFNSSAGKQTCQFNGGEAPVLDVKRMKCSPETGNPPHRTMSHSCLRHSFDEPGSRIQAPRFGNKALLLQGQDVSERFIRPGQCHVSHSTLHREP